jgi:hypothetical protein
MSDDLTPVEQELAQRLSGLGADPSPATQASIMRAVRAARPAEATRQRFQFRWRLPVAVAAAFVLVFTATVGVLAASSEALPHSPAYTLRLVGEEVRLAVAGPVGREQLQIQFARDRFLQAGQVVHDNHSDATRLVDDGGIYLDRARRNLPSLTANQQGQVQNQLNQAGQDQQAAEQQLNQNGQQG